MLRARILGLVLAMAVTGLPLAPPEHAHQADDHGHEHMLVHRHLETHSPTHQADHDGVTDHDEAAILALDPVHAVPPVPLVIGAPVSSVVSFVEPPALVLVSHRDSVEPLIHGPPRTPNGLRAPPSLTRL